MYVALLLYLLWFRTKHISLSVDYCRGLTWAPRLCSRFLPQTCTDNIPSSCKHTLTNAHMSYLTSGRLAHGCNAVMHHSAIFFKQRAFTSIFTKEISKQSYCNIVEKCSRVCARVFCEHHRAINLAFSFLPSINCFLKKMITLPTSASIDAQNHISLII